jgi:hypothetical protein
LILLTWRTPPLGTILFNKLAPKLAYLCSLLATS